MRHSLAIAFALGLQLVTTAAHAAPERAVSSWVISAKIDFDEKSKTAISSDRPMRIEGTLPGYDENTKAFSFQVGSQREWTLRLSDTKINGGRYEYKTQYPDNPGVRELVFDPTARTFSVTFSVSVYAQNPVLFILKAGSFSDCELLRFKESDHIWTFDKSSDPSYPCLITQAPHTLGNVLFANKPDTLTFYLKKNDIPAGGATLVEIDEKFNVLATLGAFELIPAGEKPSGWGEYRCAVSFPAKNVGTMRLAAIPTDKNHQPNFSPSLIVHIKNQTYTADTMAILVRVGNQAGQIYRDQLAQLKDPVAARKVTVQLIKQIPEVSDCSLAPDGFSIGIVFKFGGVTSLSTAPPGFN